LSKFEIAIVDLNSNKAQIKYTPGNATTQKVVSF